MATKNYPAMTGIFDVRTCVFDYIMVWKHKNFDSCKVKALLELPKKRDKNPAKKYAAKSSASTPMINERSRQNYN